MKKTISFFIVIALLAGILQFGFANTYAATVEKESIKSFLEDGLKLIHENDMEKEFVPEESEYQTTIEDKSENKTDKESTVQFSANKDEAVNEKPLSDTAFQTGRLLVKATKKPDKLNSTGIVSGFKDWYIVQFKNEKDTEKAYETYSSDKSVLSVSPDLVVKCYFDEKRDGEPIQFDMDEIPSRLNSWGSIMTGLYDVKDYIESRPEYDREISIGVIDEGVDIDNEFISDRLTRTYYNSSTNGEGDSEYTENAHGTMVSSVIVDNTPENVKIKIYKIGFDYSEISTVALSFIKATEDGNPLINCSFGFNFNEEILTDVLNYCYEKGTTIICSAGNDSNNLDTVRNWPAVDEKSVSVAANTFDCIPTWFTTFGAKIDLMAPGEEIPVSVLEKTYVYESGTSFSSPMVASLLADMMILYPSYSSKQIEHIVYSKAVSSDVFYDCGLFGYGIIDAIGSANLKRNTAPVFNIPEGKYIDEIEVEITAEPGCEIYYTLDGSYPSKENGICYTEPVKIQDDCPFLKAVAYGNGLYRSECTKALYRLQRVGTDGMFEISEDGQITSYTGNIYDLIIPETISGITVKTIAPEVFSNSGLVGVTFPETMDVVSEKAFINCNTLMIADGKGINNIEQYAFKNCGLYSVDFSNVQSIGREAFQGNYALSGIGFPKCKTLGFKAFHSCDSLRFIDLPILESTQGGTFTGCSTITEFNVPKWKSMGNDELSGILYIKSIDCPSLNNIGSRTFDAAGASGTVVERLELSNVETMKDIPYTLYELWGKPISIVMPSTFNTFQLTYHSQTWSELKPQIVVYGTRETYAEEWANGYDNVDFIEITPETAVINDLPNEFFDYMRYLYADVVGFNRTYQWYGSYSDSNTSGIPIEGANERKIVPKENEQYPYYYCVVTSTDVGYDPIEIRTGACKYMNYKAETVEPADYSALDEMLATIPEDLSIYTDESVEALNNVIDSIDKNLYVSNQATVDEYVEAISNALSALKLKEHMVSFIVDNESVLSYELEYGSEITDIPPNSDKTGYTFSKWTPDIPPTMPNNSLTFTAEFEPITYYASFIVDGEEIEKVPFTVESESISEPKIPEEEGYTGKWSEYIIAASDITINAEYTINEYTVSFFADDKTIKSETVEYGSPIEVPDNPQKNGYIFKEWLPKVPETMPAKDMTFYAVFEEEKQPELKPDISIRNFVNSRTIDYRTTITFTATDDNMPEGTTIIWYKDGQITGTGEKFTVKEAREAFTVQAKIVDESGNTLNSTETELVKVKTDFFSKIIAFFRMLFGKPPVIEQ